MTEAADYLDAVFGFGWFIVGAYLAWPDDQMDATWQRFGYGVLVLVTTRCLLWALA